MKTLAIALSSVLLFTASHAVSAQSANQKIQALQESQATLSASVDSLAGSIEEITTGVSHLENRISDISDSIGDLKDAVSQTQTQSSKRPLNAEDYSDMGMEWACMIIFCIGLPLLLAAIYRQNVREKQRRYDIVVDLVRSGVEIKPEMMDFITGKDPKEAQGEVRTDKGMSPMNVQYFLRRLIWGLLIILVGFIFAVATNEEALFVIFGCVGLFLLGQAAICYYSSKYSYKKSSEEGSSDGNKA